MKVIFVYVFLLVILFNGSNGKENRRFLKINKRSDGLVRDLLHQMVAEHLERRKILESFKELKTIFFDVRDKIKVRNTLFNDTKADIEKVMKRVKKIEKQKRLFSSQISDTNSAIKAVGALVVGTKKRLFRFEKRFRSLPIRYKENNVYAKKGKMDTFHLVISFVLAYNKNRKQIAFTTQLFHHPTTSSALVFKRVITNIGGGYNVSDGIFYCPKDGLYTFTVTLEGVKRINVAGFLMKNNQNVAYAYEAGAQSGFQTLSVTIALKLVSGDRVWVKGVDIQYDYNSYFTGVYMGS
ncbi:hypothetical protein KUTeg_002773 [Tegillarca granosa]|uniref:C1q domain-containing protein n=1 Tax=Tegillarca granosa TaxID=220873 RepID=A0ABQ9FVF9_TEGGR|nr:hypothetical protein KUTeg_002773 [Tegillarca granosa]